MYVKLMHLASQRLWQADSVQWGVVVCTSPPSQAVDDWCSFIADQGAVDVRTAQVVHVELDDADWQELQKQAGPSGLPLALVVRWAFLEPDRRLVVTAGDGQLYIMGDNGKTIDRVG